VAIRENDSKARGCMGWRERCEQPPSKASPGAGRAKLEIVGIGLYRGMNGR